MLVASQLLEERREVYLPMVDDIGVDMIVRSKNYNADAPESAPCHYEFQELQIKSISKGGLFAAVKCEPRPNYWFVLIIKGIDGMWLINSVDFQRIASRNVQGKNEGKYSLNLKPTKKISIKHAEYHVNNFDKLP